MDGVISVLAMVSHFVRTTVAVIVVFFAIICVMDWLVRTRRINAFHPIARFLRQRVGPLLAPVERRVVRAGGLPSAAPLWGLAFAIVAGIILITVTDFVFREFLRTWYLVRQGPRQVVMLLINWAFNILKIAIIIRVIISWLPISPYAWWVRWTFTLTEPILRPLRQIIPRIGMFDLSPIAAYFLLQITQGILVRF